MAMAAAGAKVIEFPVAHDKPPRRRPNKWVRTREHLTPDEVEQMITAVRQSNSRLAERDALLIMITYRHGLRAEEITRLRWDAIDLKAGTIHVSRVKHGSDSTYPILGPELRALRTWRRQQGGATPYIFTILGKTVPMSTRAVHHVVAEAGKTAGIEFPVHPHMLRHACGFYLANNGQDTRAIQQYLGHKNITHTVGYTQLSPQR